MALKFKECPQALGALGGAERLEQKKALGLRGKAGDVITWNLRLQLAVFKCILSKTSTGPIESSDVQKSKK